MPRASGAAASGGVKASAKAKVLYRVEFVGLRRQLPGAIERFIVEQTTRTPDRQRWEVGHPSRSVRFFYPEAGEHIIQMYRGLEGFTVTEVADPGRQGKQRRFDDELPKREKLARKTGLPSRTAVGVKVLGRLGTKGG